MLRNMVISHAAWDVATLGAYVWYRMFSPGDASHSVAEWTMRLCACCNVRYLKISTRLLQPLLFHALNGLDYR